jgi:phage gpG-like protein
MLKVTIEDGGCLQKFEALALRASDIPSDVYTDIGCLLVNSVHQNFLVSGRPTKWPPTISYGSGREAKWSNKKPLNPGGKLYNSQKIEKGKTSVTVSFGEGLKYAKIHQFGGIIRHPGSDKLQVFPTFAGDLVFTHGTEPHKISISPRKYAMYQDSDVEAIKELLRKYIINNERYSIAIN